VNTSSNSEISPSVYTPSNNYWGLFTNDSSSWIIGTTGATNGQLKYVGDTGLGVILVLGLVSQTSNQLFSLRLRRNSIETLKTVYGYGGSGSIGFVNSPQTDIEPGDYLSLWLQPATTNTNTIIHYAELSAFILPS
jgi:hypothetical protein